MNTLENSPFKAYDIRGRVPDQLDEDRAFLIGQAYARVVRPAGPVAIGYDMRRSSQSLAAALARGLNRAGVETYDIGLCGTEVVYHAASMDGVGGGIMITASHNPANYNGMKMVREQAIPISADTGLKDMEALLADGLEPITVDKPGRHRRLSVFDDYVRRIKSFIDTSQLSAAKVVVNPGNGCAGPAFDALAENLPLEVVRLHHEPDGDFPNGVPNPLLPENREETAQAVIDAGADFGIAWDGDFDRCFFFDHNGRFIEGYYLVGLFARQLLEKSPGEKIVLDPRLTWNTLAEVADAGGTALVNKSGHAFIKERMRSENALYGGEMSAHHYFRDFSYCDSGMIPWLLLLERIALTGKSLAELVDERIRAFPCSGEINFTVDDPQAVMDRILNHFSPDEPRIDRTDGISLSFDAWRFNLRASNTEPVIRLNVETRADEALLKEKTELLRSLIG
ncbi:MULTISPECIES: phosphomannomutase [unclassified Wenzhouxiangella]|uniref:phosphomannomutase n=1 Tax=unclassified Wenzhouxiangella TaxID=2613841 RepID=UPI000E325F0A|nr:MULTISPECIES: phosphomannomutase [unclassified Wenzhouxiangella]RFF26443.1 phosphomannomutase [Wenzhouxiangella sp. 15181]RFP67284.1 phosphomannomutase [Wenzhouxiangella sp. 15190]